MRFTLFVVLSIATLATPAFSQSDDINLVMPHNPGKITVRLVAGWNPEAIALYDAGTRPVFAMTNKKTGLDVSYILFPNDTKAPTAESCREAVVSVILKSMAGKSTITNKTSSTRSLKNGRMIALTSYFLAKMQDIPIKQQEVFGFYGDQNTCAEIHISKALASPADMPLFDTELDRFDYDPTYVPTSQDYGSMATIFFDNLHDPKSAVFYYQSALGSLTDSGIAGMDALTMRRVLTDQLSMAYGMSGDLKNSRSVNEAAITADPLYPLYYYNLACADAEEGNATAARTHLEQAYARKANTLKGESMPDASKDDSFLKLKSNAGFWTFVQSLPKS